VRKIGRFQRNRTASVHFNIYFLPASGALISIKRPSVDLQPNAA
jgi:hypothetical protein